MAFFLTGSQLTKRDLRGLVATLTGLVVTYCVAVLWYVATFPDVGLRCLLPDAEPLQDGGIEISQWITQSGENTSIGPSAGDRLVRLNGQDIGTFLDFVSSLQSLRFAKIPPGGQLAPGSDPAELKVPPLVEVYSRDPSQPRSGWWKSSIETRIRRNHNLKTASMCPFVLLQLVKSPSRFSGLPVNCQFSLLR